MKPTRQSALESVENKRDKTGIRIMWCMALCRSLESFIKQPHCPVNLCGPDQQFFRCSDRTSKSSIRPSRSNENLFTLINFKSWVPRKLVWKCRAHANVRLQKTELIRRPFHTASWQQDQWGQKHHPKDYQPTGSNMWPMEDTIVTRVLHSAAYPLLIPLQDVWDLSVGTVGVCCDLSSFLSCCVFAVF